MAITPDLSNSELTFGPTFSTLLNLKPGPKDFIKSLNVQDRVLSASWVKENNQLGKDMDNIMLRAIAPDEKTASLVFLYSFNNWNECQQELGIGSFKGL